MADGVHKAYTDDGVTYCGWDGHDGCGHVWPCPTVRAYRAPPPVGNPDQSLIRSVLLYGTGFRWRRPDGEVLVLDPAEVDMFVAADMPETMAEAESRGRAAGYAEAVRAFGSTHVMSEVAETICRLRLPWTRNVTNPVVDPEEYEAFLVEAQILLAAASTAVEAASRATTEETPR